MGANHSSLMMYDVFS